MCHVAPVTCHLSPVTCHLTATLCSFNCYEIPRRLGDAAARGLLIDRVKQIIINQKILIQLKSLLIWAFYRSFFNYALFCQLNNFSQKLNSYFTPVLL